MLLLLLGFSSGVDLDLRQSLNAPVWNACSQLEALAGEAGGALEDRVLVGGSRTLGVALGGCNSAPDVCLSICLSLTLCLSASLCVYVCVCTFLYLTLDLSSLLSFPSSHAPPLPFLLLSPFSLPPLLHTLLLP